MSSRLAVAAITSALLCCVPASAQAAAPKVTSVKANYFSGQLTVMVKGKGSLKKICLASCKPAQSGSFTVGTPTEWLANFRGSKYAKTKKIKVTLRFAGGKKIVRTVKVNKFNDRS